MFFRQDPGEHSDMATIESGIGKKTAINCSLPFSVCSLAF